jgi:hypothetical protein
MDDAVARLLRKTKPVLLAVNKVDNAMREKDAIEFYNLGLGEYTLQYFRKWNWRFMDALIDSFPIKPEPRKKSHYLVLRWWEEDKCWKIKFYQCMLVRKIYCY